MVRPIVVTHEMTGRGHHYQMDVMAKQQTVVDPRAHGAVGDGVADDTVPFERAYYEAMTVQGGGTILVPPGIWRVGLVLEEIPVATGAPRVSFVGCGPAVSILRAREAGTPAISIVNRGDWAIPWTIRDLQFNGRLAADRQADGLRMDISGSASGVNGLLLDNVSFHRCRTGFYNEGHIWYNGHHCTFERCGIGTYLQVTDEASGGIHAGNGQWIGCNWNLSVDAAFVVIGNERGGTPVYIQQAPRIIGGIMEGSKGFTIFLKGWSGGSWPFLLDGTQMEQNGPDAADVIIDGVTYTQAEQAAIYADCGRIVARDMPIRNRTRLVGNAHMRTINCQLTPTVADDIVCEDNARIEHEEPLLFTYGGTIAPHNLIVGGWKDRHESSTTGDSGLRVAARVPWVHTEMPPGAAGPNLLADGWCNRPFTPAANPSGFTVQFVASGPTAPMHAMRVVLTPAATWNAGIAPWPAVALTANRWYVWGLRIYGGATINDLGLHGDGIRDLWEGITIPARSGHWRQYQGIAYSYGTGGNVQLWIWSPTANTSIYLADVYLTECRTKEDALAVLRAQARPAGKPENVMERVMGGTDWNLTGAEPETDHFRLTGATAGGLNVTFPAPIYGKRFTVSNGSGQDITIRVGAGAGGTATNGRYSIWVGNATDCVKIAET